MNGKRTVAIGFIGATLDRVGKGANRWNKWRPSIGLCQQADLLIDRLELIHGTDARDLSLAERIRADIQQISPETEVRLQPMHLRNPWDFEEVYGALHDFTSGYAFDTEHEDYLVHITTGTHVAQICWFLLTEARYLPARLVQTSPARKRDEAAQVTGTHALIDLDLSRYDRIASRFQSKRLESLAFLKSGIATRNEAFNRSIEQIERVALRSSAPMLLIGPTGAGKSFLARRVYELKRSRHLVEGRFVEVNCATLRGDAAMGRCRRCSAISRAPSPVRRTPATACCARPMAACCSSTRSASWVSTSRPCCSRPSRRSVSSRWARTRR